MSELAIPFLKKWDRKYWEQKQKSNIEIPHVNKKPLARDRNFIQTKKAQSELWMIGKTI